MKSSIERLLSALQALVALVEETYKGGEDLAGISGASHQLAESLARARERIEELESRLNKGIKTGMKATDRYVHSNPWQSIGIAAAVGFILGALVSHRKSD